MSDDQILEVVMAHKKGKKIQGRVLPTSIRYCPSMDHQWVDLNSPDWNFHDQEFRIAPEPRKPREWEMFVANDGNIFLNQLLPNLKRIIVREVIE